MRTVIVTILFAAIGCSSTTERFCERLDSCNILRPGISVDECVDTLDEALGELPDDFREEAEFELEECLDRPSCSGFSTCIGSFRTGDDGGASLLTSGQLASD